MKCNFMPLKAILKVRIYAVFIQSESSEYYHAKKPEAIKKAEILNSTRFLSLDLNYGRRLDSEMYEYLMDNGLTRDEYHFFLKNNLKHFCIMGNDYYEVEKPKVPTLGIGRNCRIENAILDKNVRIGNNVTITNSGKVMEKDGENYYIRDGIVIIPKNAHIADGTHI